jgi:hypothetical protein
MYYLKGLLLATITVTGGFVLGNSNSFANSVTKTLVIDRFPTQVGNSWEYRRTFYVVVYDTVHNDTTEYLIVDSLHEEFETIDTLAGWECYRLSHTLFEQGDTFPKTWWYAHPDTALLWIAYLIGYKSKISTEPRVNIKFWIREKSFDSPQLLAWYLHRAKYTQALRLKVDTIYWSPPKKLFIFPLEVGKSWVAMINPGVEQREVVAEDSVTVPAGIFFTLRTKITSEWMEESDLWYKWIAEEGIIKDSLHVKGIATDTLGNEIGYWEADDIYELLNFQIGVEENNHHRPLTIRVLQIYPNPLYSVCTIRYITSEQTHVRVKIYDAMGRFVSTIIDRKQQMGHHTIYWDRRDHLGREVKSGIYFCHLEVGEFISIKKLVIFR